ARRAEQLVQLERVRVDCFEILGPDVWIIRPHEFAQRSSGEPRPALHHFEDSLFDRRELQSCGDNNLTASRTDLGLTILQQSLPRTGDEVRSRFDLRALAVGQVTETGDAIERIEHVLKLALADHGVASAGLRIRNSANEPGSRLLAAGVLFVGVSASACVA